MMLAEPPIYRDPIDPTLKFLYTPHSIAVLLILISCLLYMALFQSADHHSNLARGLGAAAISFLFIGTTQFSDGPFIRPHPIFWRLILSLSILYLLTLIVLLFQTVDDARQWMKWIDPVLGVTLDEKTYAEDCTLCWSNVSDKMDMFVPAHLFGWVAKALILRDAWLCWVVSVMFEVMEYSLEFQLPNFGECWWDHWLLDVLICNWAGIAIGMRMCKYFSLKTYNWRSIKDISGLSAKVKRSVEQLTPHSWVSFDWATAKSFKGYIVTLTLVTFVKRNRRISYYNLL